MWAAVLAGSEAAQGVSRLPIPRPTFSYRSVDEFASMIVGSFYCGRRPWVGLRPRPHVKYPAALRMSSLAYRNPDLRPPN